jgi:hypothetical protein
MKHLNIIHKPIERWFHYQKWLPVDGIIQYAKDPLGNEALLYHNWVTYDLDFAVPYEKEKK